MLDFFTGVFSSAYYTGIFLNLFCLICFASLGNCISLRAGFFNLGGEGQIYLGGFTAAICLTSFTFLPNPLNLILSFLITLIVTGTFSLLAAVCNDLRKVRVLLTSYLFSAALIPVLDYFVSGPLRTKEGNLLATEFIDEAFRIKSILPPSPLTAIIFLVPPMCFLFWYIFNKTDYGTELKLWGTAHEFACYSGLSYRKAMYSSLFIDGSMHALAGFFSVTAQHYTCHIGLAAGLGWNALTCALLAGKNPLYIIPSGLFLSWIFTSASRYSLVRNLKFDVSGIIQGIIIFIIAGNVLIVPLIKKILKKKEK